jgi:hypothetical protein
VAWDVEVGNVGSVAYNALPGAQTFVSHLMTNGQVREGTMVCLGRSDALGRLECG